MDDLAGKIGELLQNPAIANLLGQFGGPQEEAPQAPDMPQQPQPQSAPQGNPLSGLGIDGDTIQTVMKIAPLLSNMNQEDDNTRFLHALRPLLSDERQKKLDEAAKILQLMRMLPILKSQGIL
ncbi:hypothetical protein [Anaeromassilibacillus senegalensis]|uniref:hypothetical protein n=1 Tax=Anaeromassilibacillus senegalensis TaxID=1673717 RepID=UPI0006832456|nr:hypothetical protein [Anaeromassilibacillus senegalensis]